jgi:Ca2+-binding RTX toxin-like protein
MTHPIRRFRSLRVVGVVCAAALGLSALPAVASGADVFSCRASATRVTGPPQTNFVTEPIRANDAFTPCSTQRAESVAPQTLSAPPPFDASAAANAQRAFTARATTGVGALAGTGQTSARVNNQTVSADSAQVSVTWTCASGVPTAVTSSSVSNAKVNGLSVTVPAGPLDVPLPGGGTVHFNRVIHDGTIITVRAIEIESPPSPALGNVVIAEAKAGYTGDAANACADLAGAPPPGTTTVPSPRPCPSGSTFDPGSGNCIIRIIGPGGAVNDTTVSRPFEGPIGGTVITLAQARKRYPNSPCVKGSGPNYVVIGTNKSDHITGTNRADRILLFAGARDVGEGGVGNDCLDGGKGRDVLQGGVGNDRLYGGPGNDALNGGSGTDRLTAGAGNDTVNTGFGKDSVFGGAGNDIINAATGGPPSKVVSCGAGKKDIARINRNEKHRVRKDCETVIVIAR